MGLTRKPAEPKDGEKGKWKRQKEATKSFSHWFG